MYSLWCMQSFEHIVAWRSYSFIVCLHITLFHYRHFSHYDLSEGTEHIKCFSSIFCGVFVSYQLSHSQFFGSSFLYMYANIGLCVFSLPISLMTENICPLSYHLYHHHHHHHHHNSRIICFVETCATFHQNANSWVVTMYHISMRRVSYKTRAARSI